MSPSSRPLAATFAPLSQPAFRRIWIASLFCNAAQHIQAVTAAWMMVQLTAAPEQVALVQTASMLPIMLLALPGGALADIYDRRKSAIAALLLAFCGTLALTVLALTGAIEPAVVLAGCFVVGTGIALLTPAWQASVIELVGPTALPAGVALNAMSNNLARSVGPAVGGLAVMALGAPATLAINALLYVPMLVALLCWRRHHQAPTLLPENLGRAAFSGLRYVALAPPLRRVLIRSTLSAFSVAAVYALLPLIARVCLAGDARTYGVLLGAFGIGAVTAALLAGVLRGRLAPETSVRVYSFAQGSAIVILAFSPFVVLSAAVLFVAGACWMTNNTTYNICIQMSAPRWVAARSLAMFYASVAAGLGAGSWVWGHVASGAGIALAVLVAGGLLMLSPLLGLVMRLPERADDQTHSVPSPTAPEVRIALHGRSGPIAVEVSYRIREECTADFYGLMQLVRRSRERNGAYGSSLARDIADPCSWTERLHYPTWHDYIRARDRPTKAERELQLRVSALHEGPEPVRVRRMLERPFGSHSGKVEPTERNCDAACPTASGPG